MPPLAPSSLGPTFDRAWRLIDLAFTEYTGPDPALWPDRRKAFALALRKAAEMIEARQADFEKEEG